MRRILLIVNDIYFKGGGEKVASYIASWYASLGDSVCILSMSTMSQTVTMYSLHSKVVVKFLNVVNTKISSKFIIYNRLRKFLKDNSFDFILGIGTYANVLLGLINVPNGKKIGCEHSSFHNVSWIWKCLRKISYRNLDAAVVLTKTDLSAMQNLNPNTFVIPNSVPMPEQKASLKPKRILSIGRFYYIKGFDIMLDVYKEFVQCQPDWELVIIGEGPDERLLLDKIMSLGIQDKVKLVPPTDNIGKEYLSASIYLMTSRSEGLPMVLLEAQSYGVPMISFDCNTGPRDIIIDGYNGFLIPVGDTEKMVSCLLQLSKDDALRHKMGNNAIRNAEKFFPEKIFAMWNNLFSSL